MQKLKIHFNSKYGNRAFYILGTNMKIAQMENIKFYDARIKRI